MPSGRRRQEPAVDRTQIDGALRPLEIVDVGRALVPHRSTVPWNQVRAFRRDVEGGLRRGVVKRQPVDELGQQAAFRLPRKVGPHHRVVHGLVPHVHLPCQRPLPHVEQRGSDVEVVAGHVIEPRAHEGLRLDVEQRVRLQGNLDGLAGFKQPVVDDPHPPEVVVDGVVPVFDEAHPTGRHGHGPFRDVEGVQLDLRRTLRLEASLDAVPVQRWNLLGRGFGAVVERLEDQGLGQRVDHGFLVAWGDALCLLHIFCNAVAQVGAKRLDRRQENAAVLTVDGPAVDRGVVHVIEHPVLVGQSVDVDAVHAQNLHEQLAFERLTWDVVEVHPGVGVVVPHVQPEVLVAHAKRPHGVDVFHHHPPQRGLVAVVQLHLGDRRLEHLQNQGARRGVPVLAQRANLVGLPIQGVFVGDGQNLSVVEGLAQRDEPQTAVEREFRRAQLPRVPDALVVHTLLELSAQGARNGLVGPGEVHDPFVQGQAAEQVVVEVARGAVGRRLGGGLEQGPVEHAGVVGQVAQRQVGRHVIGVFAQVGERDDVSNVLGVGLGVHDVDLNPVDHGPGIGHRQGAHGHVVLVDEVLRQEVVSVGLVVVGADVELLGLRATLDLNFTPLAFLLAEHRGVVESSPLRFQLDPEQALGAHNQTAVERHVDVPRLDVLQDVVLLPLEADVHLVLKIEQRLRVELGPQLNLVADASADVQLNTLIEVHGARPALTLRNPGVLGVVPGVTQGDFGGPLRLDFNLVAAENHLKQLAVDFQLGGEGLVGGILFFLEFVPEFAQVALDVVVQILVQREHAGRTEQERVADGLLHLVHPRDGVVHHTVVEVARPLQRHPAWEFSGVVGVRVVVRERQVVRDRVRRGA